MLKRIVHSTVPYWGTPSETDSIFHTARYFQGAKTAMCVVRGLGAEANGRQEGICPLYFTGLFIHARSKLTSSAGATGRVYSHLKSEEFTTLDTACVSLQGNIPASCTTAIMLLNLLHGISTVTA